MQHPRCPSVRPRRVQGVSLVELMIGVTIGLILMAGMASLFVSSSQSHNELEKASRQIENGRYAIETLREDIQLAGYFGDYLPPSSAVWTSPAEPCTTILNDMGFSLPPVVPTPPTLAPGIFGYESAATLSTDCATTLANKRSGTDVLVIRRASTATVTAATAVTGQYYFQVSNCSDSPVENAYVLGKLPASFTLHGVRPTGTPATCLNGDVSPVRQYMVHIYYVADCNDCSGGGDGIPTLKMAELTAGTGACAADPAVACGSFSLRPVAEGIENMQLEYGVDTTGSDGIPDVYQTAGSVANWANVVSVKAFVLARNTETTSGYTNSKTYVLNSSGGAAVGPFNDAYRRHAYAMSARANNIAGRRQQ